MLGPIIRAGGAVALWAAATASGQAQETAAPPLLLPTITVGGQSGPVASPPALFDAREHAIGQTTTRIDEDRVNDTPAFQIGDILRDSPGISVKQGNGPRDQGISIRGSNARNGFGIRNVQLYEDGFPLTQPDGLSRTDTIDPHAYGAIDVYRGPSSAMFGNYATGGAINFNMRRGGDIGGVEFGSDAGSFGYFNEYALFGDKAGAFEYTGLVSHVRGAGFQPSQRFSTTTGDILASYAPTDADRITVKLIDNYVGTALPIRLSLNQFRRNPFQRGCGNIGAAAVAAGCAGVNLFANGIFGATTPQSATEAGLGRHDRRTILGARWEHNFDADTVWRTQLVYDNKDIDQPTGATSAAGDQPAFNLLSDLTRHGTLFGAEATHFVQFSFNTVHLANDTFSLAPGGGATLGALTQTVYGAQSNIAGRAREEIRLAPQWTGEMGIGIERTSLDALDTVFGFPLDRPSAATLIPTLRTFVNVAPEASLRWRPSDEWQLRARAATGYGTPQAGNLFVTAQGVSGNNTQLQTQTNTGFDLGAEWTPAVGVTVGATGFYERFRNEFVSQSAGAGLRAFTFNVPKSEHRGFEAAADWRFLPGWRATLTWLHDDQFYRDYTEQLSAGARTASFDRAGKRIPGVEPNNIFVRLSYDRPDGPLAGLGGFVEGYWRDSFFIDNANLVQAPSYAIVNVNLHYDPGVRLSFLKGLSVFLQISNLLDKTYVASANNVADSIDAATGVQNGAAAVAAAGGSIYAGAPRTVVAGLRMKF